MKTVLVIAALLGLSSVMMGAAGDHLFAAGMAETGAHRFDTALRYHQLYAILLFCLGLHGLHAAPDPVYKTATWIMTAGTIVFCGALYLSLIPSLSWAAAITPVGGLLLMAGWAAALFWILKKAFGKNGQP